MGESASARAYWRSYRREQRAVKKRPAMGKRLIKAKTQVDTRAGSRHRLYPCCGQRRSKCKCDWAWYRRNMKATEHQRFWGMIAKSELFRAVDTADTGYFLEEVACPLLVNGPLARIWKICVVFRRFSRPETWESIKKEILKPKPAWARVEQALRKRVERKEPLFGGFFYPTILKAYRRSASAPWVRVAPGSDMVEREVRTLQLLWASVPLEACAAYDRKPGRETFREFYSQFDRRVRDTASGVWSDYAFKCALDVLTLSGKVPDHHLCVWPEGCPAYKKALATMFAKPPASIYEALCFLFYDSAHRHGGKLRFAEVIMHLCWNQKRQAGTLEDTLQTPNHHGER